MIDLKYNLTDEDFISMIKELKDNETKLKKFLKYEKEFTYFDLMVILSRYVCDEKNCRHCKNFPCINSLLSNIKKDLKKVRKENGKKDI